MPHPPGRRGHRGDRGAATRPHHDRATPRRGPEPTARSPSASARGVLHRVHRGVYAVGSPALSREAAGSPRSSPPAKARRSATCPPRTLREISALPLPRHRCPFPAATPPRGRPSPPLPLARPARRHHPQGIPSPPCTAPRSTSPTSSRRTSSTNVIHQAAFKRPLRRARDPRRDGPRQRPPQPARPRPGDRPLQQRQRRHHAAAPKTRSSRVDLPEPLVNIDLHGFEVDFHWPRPQTRRRDRRPPPRPPARPRPRRPPGPRAPSRRLHDAPLHRRRRLPTAAITSDEALSAIGSRVVGRPRRRRRPRSCSASSRGGCRRCR